MKKLPLINILRRQSTGKQACHKHFYDETKDKIKQCLGCFTGGGGGGGRKEGEAKMLYIESCTQALQHSERTLS